MSSMELGITFRSLDRSIAPPRGAAEAIEVL
jgi:hypothetical protein